MARALLLGQLSVMVALSIHLWARGELSWDFSIYNQAAWLISHGHLAPYDTVRGVAFIDNNAELVLWPLALVTRLPGGGLWLLVVQDVVLVATGWVVVSWVAEATGSVRWSTPLGPTSAILFAAVIMVANPLAWSTALYDFHTEPIGGLLALLTGHALWQGRSGRAWLLGVATLTTGSVATLYLLAVVIGALTSRGDAAPCVPRRHVLALGILALGWLGATVGLNANAGSDLASNYGYVVGTPKSIFGVAADGAPLSTSQIALGALTHPWLWIKQLLANAPYLAGDAVAGGLFGLLDGWGLAAIVLILGPSMLARGSNFAWVGFQNEPAVGFLAVGSVFALARLDARVQKDRRRRLAGAAMVVALGTAVAGTSIALREWRKDSFLGPPQRAALVAATREVPPSADLVVSQQIAGRFSARPSVYAIIRSPQQVPVAKNDLFFVLFLGDPTSYLHADTEALAAQMVADGAHTISHRAGIWVLRWHPPRGLHTLILDGPIEANIVTDPDVYRPRGARPCVFALCGANPAYRAPAGLLHQHPR